MNDLQNNAALYQQISQLIQAARQQLQRSVNVAMVQTYWQIGQLIVEDEQQGERRAAYGTQQLEQLALQLTSEFGKGFDVRNLRNMRAFYLAYPIRNAVRSELSWTHYRTLLRVENPAARAWYMAEAIQQNWSSRALERQIAVLYYERLLASKERAPLMTEASSHTSLLAERPQEIGRAHV